MKKIILTIAAIAAITLQSCVTTTRIVPDGIFLIDGGVHHPAEQIQRDQYHVTHPYAEFENPIAPPKVKPAVEPYYYVTD